MRNRPQRTNRLADITWSRDLRWHVSYAYDNRWNVTEITATAIHGRGDGQTYGHAASPVGPFDDVEEITRALMVDAAVSLEVQLQLF
jgi:hypothetical protein